MKQISLMIFLGVVLALPIIYLLQPLNAGAIALILFLSEGLITLVWTLANLWFKKRKSV